jgi:hypothetical protein
MAPDVLVVGHASSLTRPGRGDVHSSFPRAVNLRLGSELWTLLARDGDDLPFGVRLDLPDDLPTRLGVRRGDSVAHRAGRLRVGPVVLDLRTSPRWVPPPVPAAAPGLTARLDRAQAAVSERAWAGAAPHAGAVVAALDDPVALARVVPRVVGAGPGLTPAGDDMLVGLLAALGAVDDPGAGGRLRRLADALEPHLQGTTEISAHLLRQAAHGLLGAAVHRLRSVLLAGSTPTDVDAAVGRVVAVGATSGADAATGLLAGLPISFRLTERAAA